MLAAGHEEAARRFARRGSDGAWETVAHRPGHTGSPRVAGALTVLDCAVEHRLPGGDHEIVIGRVLDVETEAPDAEPLLFFRGAFASLPEAETEPERLPTLADCALPTLHGEFRAVAQAADGDGGVVVALVHGEPAAHAEPEVHTHVACLFGDALGSLLCDCRARLDAALTAITGAGAGVLLYAKPPATALHLCGSAAATLDDATAGALLAQALGRTALPRNAYVTPVSSSETSHRRRAVSGSWARSDIETSCGSPRLSPRPSGPT